MAQNIEELLNQGHTGKLIKKLFDEFSFSGDIPDYSELSRQHDLEANREQQNRQEENNNRLIRRNLVLNAELQASWDFSRMTICPANQDNVTKVCRFADSICQGSNEETAPNLLISGTSCCGKSTLAGALARKLIMQGKKVRFLNFSRYINDLTKYRGSLYLKTVNQELFDSSLDVLILDDVTLSREYLTEAASGRLSGIIRSRNISNRSTVLVTSCQDIRSLRRKVGEYCFGGILDLKPRVVTLTSAQLKAVLNYRMEHNESR